MQYVQPTVRFGGDFELELDRECGKALYLQLAEVFKTRISTGRWPAGTRLPGIRDLAKSLEVAPLTVHRTYQLLQNDGWIASAPGRGSYVADSDRTRPSFRSLTPDYTSRGIVANYDKLDLIHDGRSLAIAGPDPSFFPGDWLVTVIRDLQREDPRFPLNLGLTAGEASLRTAIADDLRGDGVMVQPDDVFITSGGTEGLSILIHSLSSEGDAVAMDEPGLFRTQLSLQSLKREIVPIPWDDEGPKLEDVIDAVKRKKVKFFYTTPTFQNPTGRTASILRKQQLLQVAARLGLQIVESRGCCSVFFEAQAPASLRSMPGGENVLMLDTFSKVISSGFRVGFMLAPEALWEAIKISMLTLGSGASNMLQVALAKLYGQGEVEAHNRRVIPKYRARRDAMLSSLAATMPPDVKWTVPEGAFSLWVSLPAHGRFDDLYESALARRVIYTPGEVLFCRPPKQRFMRLCYGALAPEGITEAVGMLAELVTARL